VDSCLPRHLLIFTWNIITNAARITQLVKLLAMGWTVRGSKHSMGRDFLCPSRPDPRPTRPSVQAEPSLSRGGRGKAAEA